MAHATIAPEKMSRVSVDPAEMASFSRMAEDWWNPTGMFRPLHEMNGARLMFIKNAICEHFHATLIRSFRLKVYVYLILAAAAGFCVNLLRGLARR